MAVRQHHALGQPPQIVLVGHTVDQRLVLFLHAAARVGNDIGPIAVIGQQQQPLGIAIEPPNGEEALRTVYQCGDGRTALWVARRGHEAARLVDGDIDVV